MSLDIATKKQIMTEYATLEGDTGSPEIQVALLTKPPAKKEKKDE